jgi:hypothetical protein
VKLSIKVEDIDLNTADLDSKSDITVYCEVKTVNKINRCEYVVTYPNDIMELIIPRGQENKIEDFGDRVLITTDANTTLKFKTTETLRSMMELGI